MNLSSTTQSLQIVLAGVKTSLDAGVNASFYDVPIATSSIATAQQPGTFTGSTNGTTAVTFVGAPGANFKRSITEFTVQNKDTGAITLTINVVDSAVPTTIPVYTFVLQVGDNLEYISGYGISVTDSTGALKVPSASAPFSTSATRGIGYGTGAGGAVVQATNRATGVTLSKPTGTITTNNTSLASLAVATFTVTNTVVAIGDTILLSQQSGAVNTKTICQVTAVAAGSFNISVYNADAGTPETGAIILNFAVVKAVSA